MAGGTMMSRVLGLLRESLFAALFDRHITDAWTAAFRLPNMFRRLLGEGSLSVSFVPVFVEAHLTDSEGKTQNRAQNLVNGFYTVLLGVLGLITLLGVLYSESLLNVVLDEKYILDVEKFALTLRMAKIMFGFVFLISTYAYFMGILNALGRFGLAAMAPTLFNVALIVSTLLPRNLFPVDGDGLAWGVLVGGFLQMAILVPSLRKLGYFPSLVWDLTNPDVLRVFRNMLPGLLGSGLAQFTTIVNLKFASRLPEGTISYINWADRLLELPLSLVSVSLGTALLPTLASYWSRGERNVMTETSNYYLRLNLFVALPASFGLYVLAEPIVNVLFRRGQFGAADAKATASILGIYAMSVISISCVRVFVPAFYAIKNTWYPAMVSGICLVAHIFIAPLLMDHYGVLGLMWSSFLSASLNLLCLLFAYTFFVGPLGFRKILFSIVKFLVAGAAMVGVMTISLSLFPDNQAQFWPELMKVSIVGALGLFAYVASGFVLKTEEYEATLGRLFSKVKAKLSR